jgi:hypothetical protein
MRTILMWYFYIDRSHQKGLEEVWKKENMAMNAKPWRFSRQPLQWWPEARPDGRGWNASQADDLQAERRPLRLVPPYITLEARQVVTAFITTMNQSPPSTPTSRKAESPVLIQNQELVLGESRLRRVALSFAMKSWWSIHT